MSRTHPPTRRGSSGGATGRGHDGPSGEPRETPEEIFDRRYAPGEIDTDTYTKARERLEAHRPRPR